jgi:phage terminase Nu1 subunit (DNA packaging protein)
VSRFVTAGAVVTGASAQTLDQLLSAPRNVDFLRSLPQPMRREVDATLDAIRRASAAYQSRPVSPSGSGETETVPEVPYSTQDDPKWMSTRDVADVLGLSMRRVQQYAACGLATRHGGRWCWDRETVAQLVAVRKAPNDEDDARHTGGGRVPRRAR